MRAASLMPVHTASTVYTDFWVEIPFDAGEIGALYPRRLAEALVATKQQIAANILNSAFNAPGWQPGRYVITDGDGTALISVTHP